MPVNKEDLAKHSDMKEEWAGQVNQNIVKAINKMDQYDVDNFAFVDPTEEHVCEYYERFSDRDPSDAPVQPELHRATVNWAEENCPP
ncbi:hypothetical protein [Halorubrum distributum]|uniref:hypothetical protein n=1 Tax=Halorubrum distributum TaxID=29283 RepID=UPI00126975F8|nr:hypothetical protein [Halorubrum arcis]